MYFRKNALVLSSVLLVLIMLGYFPAQCAGGNLYYGVENDPEHSSSAEDLRDGLKSASGTTDEMPVKQNRGGNQILEDLDDLAQEHGANGKLDCESGVFIFHYSGHGSLDNQLRAMIGQGDDWITSDQLVDKLLEIVPECCTVLMFIDSCGSGNFQKSLGDKVRSEDNPAGALLSYYGVFGTTEGTDPDNCPRTMASAGRYVKEGLTDKKPNGKLKADADDDGTVTVKELGDYVMARSNDLRLGFSGKYQSCDYEGEKPHMDYAVTDVGIDNAKKPPKEPEDKRDNEGKSGGSSIVYDGETQVLSFSGHHMVDTGFVLDPILQADVHIPDFRLLGHLDSGHYLFEVVEGEGFEISNGLQVFMRAHIEYLLYCSQKNTFFGVIGDVEFPVININGPMENTGFAAANVMAAAPASPWITAMTNLFEPTSPDYDPDRKLYLTYTPLDPILEMTEAFYFGAESTGSDGVFGAREIAEERAIRLVADADAMVSSEDECGFYTGIDNAKMNYGGSEAAFMFYMDDAVYLRFKPSAEYRDRISAVRLKLYGVVFDPVIDGLEGDVVGPAYYIDEFPFMVHGLKDGVAPYTDENGYERMGEDWVEGIGDWDVPDETGITFNNAPGNYEYEACTDGTSNCPPEICHNGLWTPDPARTTWLGDVVGTGRGIGLEPSWITLDLGSAGSEFVRADTDGMVTLVVAYPLSAFQLMTREYLNGAYAPTLELDVGRPGCLSGDINCDGRVDFGDLAILAEHWLQDIAGPCTQSAQKRCRYRLTYMGCREGVDTCSCPRLQPGAKCVSNSCVDGLDCDDPIVWYYSAPYTDCKAEWRLVDCAETLIQRQCKECKE